MNLFHLDCSKLRRHRAQSRCSALMWKGIKLGLIPNRIGELCVDCGKTAAAHDHRDWSKPLEVDPVCLSCNKKRGPAAPWAGAANSGNKKRNYLLSKHVTNQFALSMLEATTEPLDVCL